MYKRFVLLSAGLFLNTASIATHACSALIFNKTTPITVAVNLDWRYREGAVVIHPRNWSNVSDVDSNHRPLAWNSIYGSVVFHGGTPDKPGPSADGMNEKGLTASILVLQSSQYPKNNELPTLNTADWLQYVLDNFQNVDEVIHDKTPYQLLASNYHGSVLNLHMVVNDAKGKSAVLEYLNGKLVIHTEDNLSTPVITNTDYDTAISLLNEYDADGIKTAPGGYDSDARFIRAAHYLQRLPASLPNDEQIAYAFNGLGDVAEAPGTRTPTQVSMVFDIGTKTIYFRTLNDAAVRFIPLSAIDFDELRHPLSLDGFAHLSGDILKEFKPLG